MADNKLETLIIPSEQPATASIIWLHGLGADGHDAANIRLLLNLELIKTIRFVCPHAPIRPITFNNFMPMRGWYDIYGLDRLTQEDTAGMNTSKTTIHQIIDQECAIGIDSNRIILAGFSQGGAMALHCGLRYPQPLAGILGISCYLPLAQLLAKEKSEANFHTPIMIAHGLSDSIVPVSLGQRSFNCLKELGYQPHYSTYPTEHSVCAAELDDISVWINGCL